MAPTNLAVEHSDVPETLFVDLHSRRDPLSIAGRYELDDVMKANDLPVWRKTTVPERWLFSSTVGKWCIHSAAAKQQNFQLSGAWAWLDSPHNKSMPHRTQGDWLNWGAVGPEPLGLTVSLTPQRLVELHVTEYDFGDVSLSFQSLTGQEVANIYIEDKSEETGLSILTRLATHLHAVEEDLGIVLPNGNVLQTLWSDSHKSLASLITKDVTPQKPASPCWSTTAGDDNQELIDFESI